MAPTEADRHQVTARFGREVAHAQKRRSRYEMIAGRGCRAISAYARPRASLGGLGGLGGVQIRMFGARSKADRIVKLLPVDHDLVSELRFSRLDPVRRLSLVSFAAARRLSQ